MLAKTCSPTSFVENDGFLTLMKTIPPLYSVPSRKTISTMQQNKYNVIKKSVMARLKSVNSYCLTADNWTDISNQSYLGVTFHYVFNDLEMKSQCLGVMPLYDRHNSKLLAEQIMTVLESFEIDPKNLTAIITDKAANIRKAVLDIFGESRRLPCAAHSLPHLVPDALNKCAEDEKALQEFSSAGEKPPQIDSVILKVKTIVKLVRHSVVASDKLKKLQENDGKNVLKLIMEVPTRWNSTYSMIERFILLEEYAYGATAGCPNRPAMLVPDELLLLKEVASIMEPVKFFINEISGDTYGTSSIIIPLVRCMEKALHSLELKSTQAIAFRQNLQKVIKTKFGEVEKCLIYAMSTLLDPRFKQDAFENPLDALAARKAIDKELRKLKASAQVITTTTTTTTNTTPEKKTSNLWAFHNKLSLNDNQATDDTTSGVCTELHLFWTAKRVGLDADPFGYWLQVKTTFPNLYPIALKYLSVPGTSVASERLFSAAGAIKTLSRNRLTGENVNQLLFLASASREEWALN